MALRFLSFVTLSLLLETSWQDEFGPIRIVPFFYELDSVLDTEGQERLETVTKAAIDDVERILAVVRVEKSLVLSRNLNQACTSLIAEGPNQHKCAQVKGAYLDDGEQCNGEFKIPDGHLNGLYVWNGTEVVKPVKTVYTPGQGVKNADFIIYVRADPAANCVKANALAYTKSCSRDVESGRPLAAYINICPKLVMDAYQPVRAKQIVLHELFHALGMSKDLFNTFTECHPSGCVVRNVVVEDIDGLPAVVTPAVVQRARRHFDCPSSEKRYLGVPLHIENGKYTSHWDERFMQTSIMVPSIGLAHQTVVDEITLALFDDTGWYQVNYTQAQPLIWGKDAGCEFLEKNFCTGDTNYFCQNNASICSRGLLDKATCTAVENCFIPKSKSGDECFLLENHVHRSSSDEIYSARSRCFLSDLSSTIGKQSGELLAGRCYEHRCNETGLLEIRVGNGPWMICASGTSVHLTGYSGSVRCPPDGVLCLTADPTPSTSAPPTTTTEAARLTTVSPYNETEDIALRIKLQFSDLPYNVVARPSDRYIFTRSVVRAVVRHTDVDEERISDVKISSGSVKFYFLLSPDPLSQLTTKLAYERLNTAAMNDEFIVNFNGVLLRPDVINSESLEEAEEEDRAHIIIAVAVAMTVLVTAVLIASTVALWNRYQTRLAENTTTNSSSRLELSDLNQTSSLVASNGIMLHSGTGNSAFQRPPS